MKDIQTLKRQVERGDYHVPSDQIADALLSPLRTVQVTPELERRVDCYLDAISKFPADWNGARRHQQLLYLRKVLKIDGRHILAVAQERQERRRPTPGEVVGIEADAHYVDAEETKPAGSDSVPVGLWIALGSVAVIVFVAFCMAARAYSLITGGR
jgi:hypothetical protein